MLSSTCLLTLFAALVAQLALIATVTTAASSSASLTSSFDSNKKTADLSNLVEAALKINNRSTTATDVSSVADLTFERVEYDLMDFLEKLGARYQVANKSYPLEPPDEYESEPEIQASSWQYGIFDRFTRAKTTSTTPAPETKPSPEDYRNFNTDDCGLRYYTPTDGFLSSSDPSGSVHEGTLPPLSGPVASPPAHFPTDDELGPLPGAILAAQEPKDNNLTPNVFGQREKPHQQNQQQNNLQTEDDFFNERDKQDNFGLKHDWNKELFGHEDTSALTPINQGLKRNPSQNQSQQQTQQNNHALGDELNLSARRSWRQQQIGQTLQHLGFNISDYVSLRATARENLMKLSSPGGGLKSGKAAFGDNISASSDMSNSRTLQEQAGGLKLEARVIGGTDARLGDSPWSVSLQALVSRPGTGSVEYRHYCGGTIISDRYVLTAAHCLDFMVGRESRLFVVIGDLQWRMTPSSMYGRRIPIEKLIIHAGYKSTAFGHDIGLIRTKEPMHPVKINGRYIVNRVCLPEKNVEHTGDAELVGWGLFSNRNEMAETLQIASVPILPRPLCVDLYKRRTGLIQWIIGIELITDKQICASTFGRGICQGDSGSPLVYNEKLRRFSSGVDKSPQVFNEQTRATIIGIVAFGGIRRCSYQSLPGVYMQTSKYMDWILPKII